MCMTILLTKKNNNFDAVLPVPITALLVITLELFAHGAGWVLEKWQRLPGPRHSQGPQGGCVGFIS